MLLCEVDSGPLFLPFLGLPLTDFICGIVSI